MPRPTPTPHEPTITASQSGQLRLPQGYVLARKGNVYITKNCRKLTHQAGQTVYSVQSATKIPIGIAVPSRIYSQVQELDQETSASRATAVAKKDATAKDAFERELHRLFPEMPEDRVASVVKHTLQKRSGRVGRTTKMQLSKVVALAVRAHIRHKLTDYDALLRGGVDKEQARVDVQGAVDDIARKWRGTARELKAASADRKGRVLKTGRASTARRTQREKPALNAGSRNAMKRADHGRKQKPGDKPVSKKLKKQSHGRRTVLGTNISSSIAQQPRRRSLRIEDQMSHAAKEQYDLTDLD